MAKHKQKIIQIYTKNGNGGVMCALIGHSYLGVRRLFEVHFGYEYYYFTHKNLRGETIKVDEKVKADEVVTC